MFTCTPVEEALGKVRVALMLPDSLLRSLKRHNALAGSTYTGRSCSLSAPPVDARCGTKVLGFGLTLLTLKP